MIEIALLFVVLVFGIALISVGVMVVSIWQALRDEKLGLYFAVVAVFLVALVEALLSFELVLVLLNLLYSRSLQ